MKIIVFFDTETQGFPDWKSPSDAEHQPHLVQLAAIQVNYDTREVLETMDVIIKPEGWVISEEVSDIHGITQEIALSKGIGEEEAVIQFIKLWALGERVCHNRTFDQRIMRIALSRYFGKDSDIVEEWAAKDDFHCTMQLSRNICNVPHPTKKGAKMPTLGEAYKHFTGKDLDGAHNAMVDAQACMEVFWGIVDSGG